MKKIRIYGIIMLCSTIPFVQGQNSLYGRLDEYLKAQETINNFSGAILIARNDSILLQKGYGLADREWNISNTADTKFKIGSNTKQFTAISILQLEEQGKLSLNDKLDKYFTGFEYGDTVTIHMLLTHSSGLTDYWHLKEFSHPNPLFISKDSMVALFKRQLYDFLPGKDISYSNSGYFLLGLIIEKVTGQSYEDYLIQHIFNVAGMENTGIDRFDTILSKRAKGYQFSSTGVINAFDENYRIGTMFAAGSIYSTVEDLYKLDRALYTNSILSEVSKKKMFSQYGYDIAAQKKREDQANTMPQAIDPFWLHLGYGCFADTFLSHKRIFTRGWNLGFKSTIYRYIEDNICIIILLNNEDNPDRLADAISAILFGSDFTMPYKHKPFKANPETFKKYIGKWEGNVYGENWAMEIVMKEDKLYRRMDGIDDMELIPESENTFFYSDGQDKLLEFIIDENKKVNNSWFIINGIKFNRKRIK